MRHVVAISQNSKTLYLKSTVPFWLCLSVHLRNILGNGRTKCVHCKWRNLGCDRSMIKGT